MKTLTAVSLTALLFFSAPLAQAQTANDASFERIDALRMESEYEQVLDLLQERKAEGEVSAELLWRLAATHTDIGELAGSRDVARSRYLQAVELAETAIDMAPNNAMTHLTMAVSSGRLALSSGTEEKVELSRGIKEHVDRAIALDPNLDLAYHVRGRWHYEISDLGWFTQAVVKVVYGGMPDASFEYAARDFRKAIDLNDRVVHRVKLAEAYLKLGKEAQARAQLTRAVEMPLKKQEAQKYKVEAAQMLEELS